MSSSTPHNAKHLKAIFNGVISLNSVEYKDVRNSTDSRQQTYEETNLLDNSINELHSYS